MLLALIETQKPVLTSSNELVLTGFPDPLVEISVTVPNRHIVVFFRLRGNGDELTNSRSAGEQGDRTPWPTAGAPRIRLRQPGNQAHRHRQPTEPAGGNQ